jgi:acetyl esterase/lipase
MRKTLTLGERNDIWLALRKDYKKEDKKRIGMTVVFLALFVHFFSYPGLFTQQLTVKDLLAFPPAPADHRIAYGDDPHQFGQLRLPKKEGLFPVAIVIHGGCWLSQYDLHHISSFATEITKMGIATWSLEYRRIGNKGGGWPGTFQDVAAGADYLRNLARKFPLDLERVVVIGHSAGGHLALWLAARSKIPPQGLLHDPDPLPVKGVVSLAGVGDLILAVLQEVCGGAIPKLMGGEPVDVPDRYAQGSPLELLPFGVPQVLIQGAKDKIVPVKSVEDYYEAAAKSGDKVDLILLQEAGHFELIMPTTFAWPEVRKAIETLIK